MLNLLVIVTFIGVLIGKRYSIVEHVVKDMVNSHFEIIPEVNEVYIKAKDRLDNIFRFYGYFLVWWVLTIIGLYMSTHKLLLVLVWPLI